jgi:rhodanese-related sulfurtransferase
MAMKRPWLVLAIACALFAGPASMARAAEDTPTTLAGGRVISAEELRALLGQDAVKIYDLRKKASYVEGHVPGAASAAPHYNERENRLDTRFLNPDRAGTIVFYSHGAAGWKSYWAAKNAIDAGYKNVLWFRGGYAEWEEKNLPITR